MGNALDVQSTQARARAMLDARVDSVRVLVEARQEVHELRDRLSAAEAADAKAYRSALSDGWSHEELRKLGLDEPAKAARVRRKSTRRSPQAAHPATDTAPQDDATTA